MCEFLTTKEAAKLLKLGEEKTNNITNNTKEQVEDLTSVKSRILGEINKAGFPDLEFLFSPEALEEIPALLDELLEEEKAIFQKLISKNPEDVVFDDFIEETPLDYLFALLEHLDGVKQSETTETIIDEFQEKYTQLHNDRLYSKELYNIYLSLLSRGNLDKEKERIILKAIKHYEINGINLDIDAQEKLKEINIKLDKLGNEFKSNVSKSKDDFSYHITDYEVLKDLPEQTLEEALIRAKEEGKEGYLFNAEPTSYLEVLKYCSDSKIRRDFYEAWRSFGSTGKYDNRGLILDFLNLRKEKAELLGYKNYAEYVISPNMADSPEQVFELIGGLKDKAMIKAENELKILKEHFDISEINPWDVGYYQDKYQVEMYNIDEKEIKKYLKYENIMDYLLKFAKEFYGLDLKEIEAKVYDSNVKVYEVYKNDKLISYYFTNFFYNEGKRPGAWANNLRAKSTINGLEKLPVVLNVCNYQKNENSDILLTIDDIVTLFHEFGHAIHEMLSESEYSDLSGFHVEMDFVELPSQITENWVKEKEALSIFAKHHVTLDALDSKIIDKLEESDNLFSGLRMLNQNTFALLDMYLHTIDIPNSVEELDKKVMEYVNSVGIFERDENYKMHAGFMHIFGLEYEASYYSYMWAELLEADVFARIKEMGMFDREVGEKFISTILGQGARKPAAELFRDFMGRDLDNTAFMKRKGLL